MVVKLLDSTSLIEKVKGAIVLFVKFCVLAKIPLILRLILPVLKVKSLEAIKVVRAL